MKEIYRKLAEIAESKSQGALATVVSTKGSAPRKAGAKMLVLPDGSIVGTVGGGYLEAEVRREASVVMKTGGPRLLTYTLTADLAAESGMICGGTMELFVEPVAGSEAHPLASEPRESDAAEVARHLLELLDRDEMGTVATVLRSGAVRIRPGMRLLLRGDGSTAGSLAGTPIEQSIAEGCKALFREGEATRVARYGLHGAQPESAVDVYLELVRNRPTAIVVGAGHVGVQVARIAKAAGFEVTVVDDRPDFATPERLPEADRVIAGDLAETLAALEIGRSSYVVLVTRGHQQDEVALRQVVNSPAAYVGMIGSRRRVQAVREQLLADGFDRARLDAVYAPIGLDIGAETPEEIAISIVAEMVKVMHGGRGESLRDRAVWTRP